MSEQIAEETDYCAHHAGHFHQQPEKNEQRHSASDMYISGGSNVYPREIEEAILTHGAISEVAVVGVPDPQWGEVGVAVCVLNPGARCDDMDLLEFLKERIAKYKMPRRVLYWDALPKSGYGKVPKRMVLDELKRRELIDA